MNVASTDIKQARDLVDLHLPIVVGAAMKLAMSGVRDGDVDQTRRASGLTVYHWGLHSSRVLRLTDKLRSILPPP